MRIQRIGRITADYFVDRTYDLATSGNEEGEQARDCKMSRAAVPLSSCHCERSSPDLEPIGFYPPDPLNPHTLDEESASPKRVGGG